MKRVKFRDGTYGIRRRICFFFFQYKSLDDGPYWWGRRSQFFVDCKTRDNGVMNEKWVQLTDAGRPL
jgi:hypothetical protein